MCQACMPVHGFLPGRRIITTLWDTYKWLMLMTLMSEWLVMNTGMYCEILINVDDYDKWMIGNEYRNV